MNATSATAALAAIRDELEMLEHGRTLGTPQITQLQAICGRLSDVLDTLLVMPEPVPAPLPTGELHELRRAVAGGSSLWSLN
jgi:hypothetical protein